MGFGGLGVAGALNPMAVLGTGLSIGSDLYAAKMQSDATKEANDKNIAAQREFAQQGIRWKVADAEAAGLSPLAALGATGASFSPSFQVNDAMAHGVRDMGQDISRAVMSMKTPDEKLAAYTLSMQALNLEHGRLENELLKSQIARINHETGPGLPGVAEAPPVSDLAFSKTKWGYDVVPSIDFTTRTQNAPVASLMWGIRNRLMNPINGPAKDDLERMDPLPRGQMYYYSPITNSYIVAPNYVERLEDWWMSHKRRK